VTQPQSDEDPEPDLSQLGFRGTAGIVLQSLGIGVALFGWLLWRVHRPLRRDLSVFSWYHAAGLGIAALGFVMAALSGAMVRLATERRAERQASGV
jgi:hypothetical protein